MARAGAQWGSRRIPMMQQRGRPTRTLRRWVALVCVGLLSALALHLVANECAVPSPGAFEVVAVDAEAAEHAAAEYAEPGAAASVEADDMLGMGAAGACAMLLLAAVTWLVRRLLGRPQRRGVLMRRMRAVRWSPWRSQPVVSPDRVALSVCRC